MAGVELIPQSLLHANVYSTEVARYFDRMVGNYWASFGTTTSTDADEFKSSFDTISRIYRGNLRKPGRRPDWSVACNRRAYVLRFFVLHSYIMYRTLLRSVESFRYLWENQYKLRVCCLGGGPGSDLFGLSKFLRDSSLYPRLLLDCTVFDLHPEWDEERAALKREDPALCKFPERVTYSKVDLTSKVNHLTPEEHAAIRSADLVTMTKSFSAISAFIRTDAARGTLLWEMFCEMKPGAMLLYIDNSYSDQHVKFWRLAESAGFRECLFQWHGQVFLPYIKHAASAKRASIVDPLDHCSVSIMLLQKPYPMWFPNRAYFDYY